MIELINIFFKNKELKKTIICKHGTQTKNYLKHVTKNVNIYKLCTEYIRTKTPICG